MPCNWGIDENTQNGSRSINYRRGNTDQCKQACVCDIHTAESINLWQAIKPFYSKVTAHLYVLCVGSPRRIPSLVCTKMYIHY